MFNADESLAMDVPMYHRKEIYPSTHVLQFLIWVIPVFASISPVLHPLMHQPPSYTYVFWKAVNYLAMFGFTFLSMNGEQSNRDVVNILLSHQDTRSFTINRYCQSSQA